MIVWHFARVRLLSTLGFGQWFLFVVRVRVVTMLVLGL